MPKRGSQRKKTLEQRTTRGHVTRIKTTPKCRGTFFSLGRGGTRINKGGERGRKKRKLKEKISPKEESYLRQMHQKVRKRTWAPEPPEKDESD